ncbi:MAG: OmpH/Skp family outer membrane protein [Planctomycetota bacterium]|jgi:outer membrane protein
MKRLIPALLLLLALPAAAAAQDRVGYANLDLIIARMPESKEVAKQLDAYQDELKKTIDTKRAYAQQKLVEAQDAQSAGIVSDEKLAAYETELRGLDREIRQAATEADTKMMERRNDLMEPVIEKLQTTIQAVAETDGYTHVFNVLDGTGTSVLLWGRDDHDLTDRILAELGIPEIPGPPTE